MRSIRQVDANTGEVLDAGVLVYVPQRPRISGGWMMAFQDGLVKLAKQKELKLRDHRVLMLVMGKLDFENFIHLSQADIARELGMHRSDVSASMRLLVELGIVVRGPKVGRSATYRLAPEFGWKGRVKNLEQYRRDQLKLVVGESRKVDEEE